MLKSPGSFLTSGKNSSVPQLGDYLIKTVRPVIVSNEVLNLQMTSIGSHNRPGSGREGRKERKKERKKERMNE